MGVDARIFIKIKDPQDHLPKEKELEASYELASCIGNEKFFITEDHHALSIVGSDVLYQDGPDIRRDSNEQIIEVNLWSRYYGPDYARGDWLTIKAIAEWLELHFPTCEVWYGGDSSGICTEYFDVYLRQKFHNFFLMNGRKPYTRYELREAERDKYDCPRCQQPMLNYGGGGAQQYLYCDGCGKHAIEEKGVAHFYKHNNFSDTFKASEELRTKGKLEECAL